MKKLLFPLFCLALIGFYACGGEDDMDDPMEPMAPEYNINIISPTTDDKKVNDKINIEVDFTEANNNTIHHVQVRIVDKADGSEVYDAPSDAHVHRTDGKYEFRDEFNLGVNGHTDWLVIAKVWGHMAGAHEKSDTVEFHVHPR
ncbi:MAG: hypothetical protein AAFV95_25710 [Bacteroidota bacterium]